jgi:hypothetical protein
LFSGGRLKLLRRILRRRRNGKPAACNNKQPDPNESTNQFQQGLIPPERTLAFAAQYNSIRKSWHL